MDDSLKKELSAYLSGFISDTRKKRFEEVLSHRTDHLRVVLENVYQDHNASAVLRSCESFGIQHVHFIENRNALRISDDVSMGSHKWLSIHRHNQKETNTVEALRHLKSLGYRIVATTPHKNDCTVDMLPVDKKLAIVFGTELTGITQDVLDEADEFVKIPMYGFTESFNVSVCAALCMYDLTTRIRRQVPGYLMDAAQKDEIYFNWLKGSVDNSEALINDYLKKKQIGG
jgi:tRNA (guanosine-2'-O-)-methyltransferase